MKIKIKIISAILAAMQLTTLYAAAQSNAAGAKGVVKSGNTSAAVQNKAGDITLNAENGIKLSDGKSAEFTVNIKDGGAYNTALCFKPVSKSTHSVNYSIKIDGAFPFAQAENLRADCIYENGGEISALSTGDQIAPEIKHIDGVMESDAYDITGVILMPLEFNLSAGAHTVTVTSVGDEFMLYGIKLKAPQNPPEYSAYTKQNKNAAKYGGRQIVTEGESAVYKNDYSVSLRSDTESALVSPSNPTAGYINYIGGTTWSSPGQELVWEVDVPQDGMYKIGASFKQSTIMNGSVYRILKIDGKIPFKEAADIPFGYSTGWQFKSFADENGGDYLFYLTKGRHTLSLTVTLSDVAEVFDRLNKIVENLGKMYLDIVMITGESPDANRDYELHKQIPDFQNKLKAYKKETDSLTSDVKNKYRVNGELAGSLQNMSRVLANMIASVYNAHLYITSYYSYYQTMSSWLYDIKNMSMSLDKLVLAAPDSKYDTGRPNIFGKMAFSLKRFLSSFTGDYNVVSLNDSDAVTIKLWVNWGRDQVKVLNSLIKQSFSAKSGINVRVEQVNASLVQGVISNNSPDLYLQLSRTEPVNLAMRGVIYDLSKFSDFEEVLKQFNSSAEQPYIYRGGVYALPDTQSFNVMFYRTDILEELGIKPPATWQEFLAAAAVIQRKKMNVYLPYTKIAAESTVNIGAGGLTIFPTMLMQRGGSIYNSRLDATALAEPVAVETFNFWTDFYSRYSLDVDTNFTQRFRVGTIPLGVAPYGQDLTFAVAAPEINGKWKIAEIPGFKGQDGTVCNISAGGGSGCVIMNSSKYKNEAWEFLKWWVSADTQYEYSSNIEAIIGASGRTASSNPEAVSRLSWDRESLNVILSQWKKVREIPEAPGSYYVSRSIDQAFWAVYNEKSTPKEAITDWARISDGEIERKIEEYAGKAID